MLEWIKTHPEIVAFVVTAIFTFFTKPRSPEEYASMDPRIAAFLKTWAAIFPDPRKAAASAAQIITGKSDPKKDGES